MEKFKIYAKRMLFGLPVASIIGASFFPLHALGHQFLVLFTLLWCMVYILFDAFIR